MKKIPYLLFFIFWIALSFIEIFSPYILDKKIFFWRAWEYSVYDESNNVGSIPFKPLASYTGTIYGDLLRGANIKPTKEEVRVQEMSVDEYGYRNKENFLDLPIDAVVFGSSQVVGLADTQRDILAEILTNKYAIRTYTYPKAPIQQFFEDSRFKKNSPMYAIVIARDYEFITSPSIINLNDTQDTIEVRSWTKGEWEKEKGDRLYHKKYEPVRDFVQRYSISRLFLNNFFIEFVNALFNREELINIFGYSRFSYDKLTGMIFSIADPEDPRYGSLHKTKKDLENVLFEIGKTKEILARRGITLIVGVVPTKSALYDPQYSKINYQNTEAYLLEQEMYKKGIDYVPLVNEFYIKKNSEVLYHPDDSHWNHAANEIIAEEISNKILTLTRFKK